MGRELEHAHLDPAERMKVGRIADSYRDSSKGLDRCVRELVQLGFDRDSAERYMALVDSTCNLGSSILPFSVIRWDDPRRRD